MESQTPNGQVFPEDYLESTSITTYGSAPSSPGRAPRPGPGFISGGFFYSAPASPMHFAITSSMVVSSSTTQPSSPDFEFSARFGSSEPGQTGSLSSADELFLKGKIRPIKLSTHLERTQALTPLLDLQQKEEEEEDLRGKDYKSTSLRRRTRSMSPLRTDTNEDIGGKAETNKAAVRSSKRWVFLKDILRTKSEGRSNSNYYKLWSTISFYPVKGKKPKAGGGESKKKPMNWIGKRRVPVPPSPHELLYTANRAQAEESRKKIYLPYRQGLLGCLGFSSKGYSTMNGLDRALNQVN